MAVPGGGRGRRTPSYTAPTLTVAAPTSLRISMIASLPGMGIATRLTHSIAPARPVSVGGGGDPVAVLGAAGGAVVKAEFDLALSSQLGEVALGGGAADSDLFGDLGG